MGWFTDLEAKAKAEDEKITQESIAWFEKQKTDLVSDFHTRLAALEHAVAHCNAVASAGDVVEKAKEFYTFLKGEV